MTERQDAARVEPATTVIITRQELDFLKHAAHQYVESIGGDPSTTQVKHPVGFQPPQTATIERPISKLPL